MIMGVAEFVTARLDEVEANARDALAQWPDTHFTIEPGSLVIVAFHRAHDPARVLREVAAIRAIVESQASLYVPGHVPAAVTLRHLATIWSNHPDYQEALKP